jgi:nitrite reductase/ring-hydroxylating ferredoxin subunit
MKKVFFCDEDDISKNDYIVKWVDDFRDEIIIFKNKQKKLTVFSSICPHFGGELIYDKKNSQIKCKWHNWKFHENTGKCLTHPIPLKLKEYKINVNPKNLKKYNIIFEDKKIYVSF